jgi:hypothetical protein
MELKLHVPTVYFGKKSPKEPLDLKVSAQFDPHVTTPEGTEDDREYSVVKDLEGVDHGLFYDIIPTLAGSY